MELQQAKQQAAYIGMALQQLKIAVGFRRRQHCFIQDVFIFAHGIPFPG